MHTIYKCHVYSLTKKNAITNLKRNYTHNDLDLISNCGFICRKTQAVRIDLKTMVSTGEAPNQGLHSKLLAMRTALVRDHVVLQTCATRQTDCYQLAPTRTSSVPENRGVPTIEQEVHCM